MKRSFAILFLAVQLLPAICKVGLFTFFQLNRDYITENYCVNNDRPITMCYGQCFLDKGILLVDQTSNPDSLLTQLKLEMPEFLVTDFAFDLSITAMVLIFPASLAPSIIDGISTILFRPPLV